MKKKKLKIAITGGIGAGKSLFSNHLIEKGCKVISADEVSKEILRSDPKVKNAIVKLFGHEAYKDDEPDTKYLADIVFSKPENVELINSIIHPEVIKKIKQMMDRALDETNLVFVEAALIYEAGMQDMFDLIILITADESIKIKRGLSDGKLSEAEIRKRMLNQISDEEKKKAADFIFENNGQPGELIKKADLFLTIAEGMVK